MSQLLKVNIYNELILLHHVHSYLSSISENEMQFLYILFVMFLAIEYNLWIWLSFNFINAFITPVLSLFNGWIWKQLWTQDDTCTLNLTSMSDSVMR